MTEQRSDDIDGEMNSHPLTHLTTKSINQMTIRPL